MDRMFLIDPSWDEKEDIDAYIARRVLQQYTPRSCDHCAIGNPNTSYDTSIVPVGDLDWVTENVKRQIGANGCES